MKALPPLVLLHSPLVGPATWAPAARELRRLGETALVPAVRRWATGPNPSWRTWVDEAAAEVEGVARVPLVLVGHSGAGPLLPILAARLPGCAAALIFVDADLPPESGPVPIAPPRFLAMLRTLAADGVLPPWSEWWGPDAMATLVPDAAVRRAIERELPRLPLSYFEDSAPVPAGWSATPWAYFLFSDVHESTRAAAASRGMPTAEVLGGHLAMAVRPREVAAALVQLASALLGDQTAGLR